MSLKIEKKNEGTKDTVFLTGRLDTTTASELDTFAEKELINTQELVLDFIQDVFDITGFADILSIE